MKNNRAVNIDVLRILSMLLIIWLHSIDHSGVLEMADKTGGLQGYYIRFSYMLVQVCVNCYVLISGYFLVQSKFRVQKLMALWLEVVFYSVFLKLCFMIGGYIPFSIIPLVSCLLPVFTGRYWFITIYFGLYIIAPFLNICINAMNREEHLKLNIVLSFLFSCMISVYPSFAGMNSGAGWGLPWFVVLYFVAAWFRKYYKPTGKFLYKFLGWIVIALITSAIFQIGSYVTIIKKVIGNWYRYDSIPVLVMSLLVFVGFLNINIGASI